MAAMSSPDTSNTASAGDNPTVGSSCSATATRTAAKGVRMARAAGPNTNSPEVITNGTAARSRRSTIAATAAERSASIVLSSHCDPNSCRGPWSAWLLNPALCTTDSCVAPDSHHTWAVAPPRWGSRAVTTPTPPGASLAVLTSPTLLTHLAEWALTPQGAGMEVHRRRWAGASPGMKPTGPPTGPFDMASRYW